MDVRYIDPFLKAIQDVFDTMIQVPFKLGKPHLKEDKMPLYEVSSIIGLTGPVSGSVVVSLSKQLSLELASALAGERITELNDDCTDALGEIANMIAGSAKAKFPSDGTSISIPSVVVGKHKVAYPKGLPTISIPCETSTGRLAVDVTLKEVATPVAASADPIAASV